MSLNIISRPRNKEQSVTPVGMTSIPVHIKMSLSFSRSPRKVTFTERSCTPAHGLPADCRMTSSYIPVCERPRPTCNDSASDYFPDGAELQLVLKLIAALLVDVLCKNKWRTVYRLSVIRTHVQNWTALVERIPQPPRVSLPANSRCANPNLTKFNQLFSRP